MASKRYGVNISRTITIEQTVYVHANNDADAIERVHQGAEAGLGGDPFVEFRRAKGIFKDAEGGEIN